jgi:cellulose synthase/poly-beta-1,6-N-acetylglucosamine synthase-like glycosyltransferase
MSSLNCVHVAPGPFSIYRKKILEEVGGFDEDNLTEDMEVTLRIQRKHYKIKQLLDVVVYTNAPKNIKGFYKQRDRWHKGTFLNLLKYRDMLLNKRYGDFGILQLPSIFISGFLAVGLLSITLYKFILKPGYNYLTNLGSINFDVFVFLRNLTIDITWLKINYTNIFFGVVSILFSLLIIKMAHKHTKEKLFKHGLLSVPFYLLMYGILSAMVWTGVFVELMFGKKQKW